MERTQSPKFCCVCSVLYVLEPILRGQYRCISIINLGEVNDNIVNIDAPCIYISIFLSQNDKDVFWDLEIWGKAPVFLEATMATILNQIPSTIYGLSIVSIGHSWE